MLDNEMRVDFHDPLAGRSISAELIRTLFMLVCLLAPGCGSIAPSTGGHDQPPAASEPDSAATRSRAPREARPEFPMAYFIVRQVDQEGSQPADGRVVKTYQIHFEYPEFVNPAFAELNRAIKELATQQRLRIMDLAGFLDADFLKSSTLPWQSTLSYELAFFTNTFVSLVIRTRERIGNNPEQLGVRAFNFDAGVNSLITLEQCLISRDALATLSQHAQQQLTAEPPEENAIELLRQGTEPVWTNYQCFVLAASGITLYFPPGQVAKAAQGILRVSLPWPELAGRLSPEFVQFWSAVNSAKRPTSFEDGTAVRDVPNGQQQPNVDP